MISDGGRGKLVVLAFIRDCRITVVPTGDTCEHSAAREMGIFFLTYNGKQLVKTNVHSTQKSRWSGRSIAVAAGGICDTTRERERLLAVYGDTRRPTCRSVLRLVWRSLARCLSSRKALRRTSSGCVPSLCATSPFARRGTFRKTEQEDSCTVSVPPTKYTRECEGAATRYWLYMSGEDESILRPSCCFERAHSVKQ